MNNIKKKIHLFNKSLFLIICGWTALLGLLFFWNIYNVKNDIIKLAESDARQSWEKDVIYRLWAAQHGGVYVPVTKETQPNPYLPLHERDVTIFNRQYTLMNPAFMTRQIYDLTQKHLSIQGHLTSLKPIRPANVADAWETKALHRFEEGVKEVKEIIKDNFGDSYVRLMRPFTVDEPCMQCHAKQGYKVGDIRGGIAITVPLNNYLERIKRNTNQLLLLFLFIWLSGTSIIALMGKTINKTIYKLSRSKEQMTSILDTMDSSGFGLYIVDENNRIRHINSTMTKWFGYSVDQICYQNKSGEENPCSKCYLTDIIKDGKTIQYERSTGDRKFEVIATPITLYDGTPAKMEILTDVTRQKQIAEKMLEAKEAAESATAAKSSFLANMSHEIRTPMNAIIGMSKLTLDTKLNSRQRNFVTKVHYSAESLLRILNDILDFSKIEADKLELEVVDFSLQGVLDNLRSLIGYKADEQGVTLNVVVDPNVPPILRGDPIRLGQILTNLGNNAVKFTGQGEITIKIKLDKRKDDLSRLHFSICDTGIGISQEQQQRLFQAFNQADSSTSRRYGGTGLGLTICARLCALMGGKIWVESEPGTGACFHFTVQLKEGDAALVAQPVIESSEAIAQLYGANILLVEDNELNQELAMELLTGIGIRVTLACNGQEALDILQEDDFDGVLMDIQMPVMDGYTATRKIREQLRFKDLPIIAMTANVMAGDLAKAEASGMNEHISKPLDVNQMFNTMACWITPSEQPEVNYAPQQRPEHPAPPFEELVTIDTNKGLTTTRHNSELYQRLLIRFHTDLCRFIDEFRIAQKADDSDSMTRIAHTLKGSAGTVGATGIQDAAAELESLCQDNESFEVIESVLNRLSTEMEPIITELADFHAAQSAPVADVDPARINALVEQLKTLLREDDPQALTLLEEFEAVMPKQQMTELKNAMEGFDFESALEVLKRYESDME